MVIVYLAYSQGGTSSKSVPKTPSDLEKIVIKKKKWDRGPLRGAQPFREGADSGRAQPTNALEGKYFARLLH